jgi:hypothetical protein
MVMWEKIVRRLFRIRYKLSRLTIYVAFWNFAMLLYMFVRSITLPWWVLVLCAFPVIVIAYLFYIGEATYGVSEEQRIAMDRNTLLADRFDKLERMIKELK